MLQFKDLEYGSDLPKDKHERNRPRRQLIRTIGSSLTKPFVDTPAFNTMDILRKAPLAFFALVHGSVSYIYLTKGSLGVMNMFHWPDAADKTDTTMAEDLALSMAISYEMVLCGLSTLTLLLSSSSS